MKIDVVARSWGGPSGASNGMAMAAAYLAHTLSALGHEVRKLNTVDGFAADLIITTASQEWKRTVKRAREAFAVDRLVYWHHAGGVPEGRGCILAAPPSIELQGTWARHLVLPPSSWAVEAGGDCTGGEIVVAGAGPAKGGHISFEVARQCPDLRWLVLRSRSSAEDCAAWECRLGALVTAGVIKPAEILARARAILSPTRFEVHPLLLVEAAARGIPIVCTAMPSTFFAAGDGATYVEMNAPAEAWVAALRTALGRPTKRLQLRPYIDVVSDFLDELQAERLAA